MPIDYDRMNKVYPKQKAALTRAQHKPELTRYAAVLAVCKSAVRDWDAIGAWPDNWSLFQRALDDASKWPNFAPRLENLER